MKVIQKDQWSPLKMNVFERPNDKLCITTQEGHHIITKDEIVYLQASSNYTQIFQEETKYLCSSTLHLILEKINASSFVRIHRSYVINMDKIKFINNTYSELTTTMGNTMPISRSQRFDFKAKVQEYFD